MTDIEQIEAGLKRRLNGVSDLFLATVVLDDSDTVTVKDLNGTSFPEVRKIATKGKKGLLFRLPIDSFVIVGRISGTDDLCIVMMSEVTSLKLTIDEIIINEGTNNGLIIIEKLKSDLSKYSSVLTALKAALDAFIPAGTLADAATLASALKLAMSTYQSPTFSEIENPKIKH